MQSNFGLIKFRSQVNVYPIDLMLGLFSILLIAFLCLTLLLNKRRLKSSMITKRLEKQQKSKMDKKGKVKRNITYFFLHDVNCSVFTFLFI